MTCVGKSILISTFILACIGYNACAKVYHIKSAKDLEKLSLVPGDTVVMQEGVWKDQQLFFKGSGTMEKPIVLRANHPDKLVLQGKSSLTIDGQWLIVDGLQFKDGLAEKDIISFSDSASWCRLTNSAVIDFNPPDKKTDNRYVSLKGFHNRVDHCFFKGKTNHGPTLTVWLSEKPNYHRIDHNHFGYRPPLGENGGETICIGSSTWSLYDSYTTLEYNLFDHCDGELEIISNKSCHNTIRYNTFFESQGTLTLRHGNGAIVYGNFFIGNNIENTGGIRIIGEDHVVFGNYFQDLKGKGLSAAICFMDGIPDSPLNGYYQVKNPQVIDNTIIRCEEAFSMGTGKNEKRYLPPANGFIAANHIVPGSTLIQWHDEAADVRLENNIVYQDSVQVPSGFVAVESKFCRNLTIVKKQDAKSPPLIQPDVGPAWRGQKH